MVNRERTNVVVHQMLSGLMRMRGFAVPLQDYVKKYCQPRWVGTFEKCLQTSWIETSVGMVHQWWNETGEDTVEYSIECFIYFSCSLVKISEQNDATCLGSSTLGLQLPNRKRELFPPMQLQSKPYLSRYKADIKGCHVVLCLSFWRKRKLLP